MKQPDLTRDNLSPAIMSNLVQAGLKKVRQKLHLHASLRETLDTLIEAIEEQYPDMIGSILLLRGTELHHGSAAGLPEDYCQAIDGLVIGFGVGSCGTAAYTGEQVIVENIETHPYWEKFKDLALKAGVRACWSQPILSSDGKVLGTFALYYREPKAPTEAEIALLESMAELAGIVLEMKANTEEKDEKSHLVNLIAENATAGLFMMNDKGICTFMNPAAEAMTGYKLHEIQTKPLHEWIHHTHPDGTPYPISECPIDRALPERNQVRAHKDVFVRKDGTFFNVLCAAEPIIRHGEAVGTVVEVRDITEQVRIDQELEWQSKLTAMIAYSQSLFFSNQDIYDIFEEPLQQLLNLTQSEYGFIGEILKTEDGRPYLKCCFLTNIGWDEKTRKLWEDNRKTGFEFHKLDNIFGEVISTGQVVISNDPAHDPRRSKEGRPEGHPPLKAFLGIPFYKNGRLAGMVGIANRPGGYDMALVERLQPFMDACANIIEAYRNQREREQLNQILTESEARFRTLADAAPVAIFMAGENAEVTYWNKTWLDYTGQTFEESLGRAWSEIVHPDDYELTASTYEKSFKAQTSYELEVRLKGRDGQYRWFYSKGGPRYLPNGELAGFIGTIIDIHDRKLAESALQESEERFRAITESMPQIVWSAKPDGYRDYYNQQWSKFTGADLESSKGSGWRHMCHPDDEQRVVDAWYHSVKSGEPFEVEYKLRAADGTYHDFLGRALPIRDEKGKIIRWFGTSTNISDIVKAREMLSKNQEELERMVAERTQELEAAYERIKQEMEERSKAEEALRQSQKMEAVGQLTGGLAHDFNNLLTVIAGNTEMAQMKADGDAKLSKYLSQVAGAAERGKKLTEQLLAFSRRQKLDPATINLNKVISDLSDMVSKTLGANIIFETKLSPALWNAHIDQTQFELAVINILVNARDAMKDGGTVMITTRNVELNERDATAYHNLQAGRYVCLSITDDGCGMPPDILARVTEPFFTTKDVGKGTGLGLSQVYGFVRQSNGQLNIYSEPGMGTTIRMYFPAVMGSVQTQQSEDVSPGDQQEALATILVVEDNNEVRDLACNVLQDQGYQVLCAENAEMALEWIQGGEPIDLMFSDVAMPGGMNGVSLAIEVRKQRPNVKILLTTGFANDVIRPSERMQFKVLQKPYRPSDLLHWVKNLLEE